VTHKQNNSILGGLAVKSIIGLVWTLILLLVLTFGVPATSVAATIYELNLGAVYAGSTPAGPAPWLTAQFEDLAPNKVRLTLVSHLSSPNSLKGASNENGAQGWVFNFGGDPGILTFNQVSSSNGVYAESIFKAKDALSISPASGFDIGFDWDENARFVAGAVETYDITGTGIHAIDFMQANAQGYYSAAHVQEIGQDSGKIKTSTFNTAPIPGAVWLLGSGLLGLVGFRRKFVG
jgi:hypothetical protein